MIADLLTNASLYESIGPRIAAAFRFLGQPGLLELATGRHEIDGDGVYALVSEYHPKPLSHGKWEAHQKYIDLQYVAAGVERIGVAPIGRLQAGDYNPAKDMTILTGSGDYLTVAAGQFMILWPGDAHMPGLDAGIPGLVRKVVVKILA